MDELVQNFNHRLQDKQQVIDVMKQQLDQYQARGTIDQEQDREQRNVDYSRKVSEVNLNVEKESLKTQIDELNVIIQSQKQQIEGLQEEVQESIHYAETI